MDAIDNDFDDDTDPESLLMPMIRNHSKLSASESALSVCVGVCGIGAPDYPCVLQHVETSKKIGNARVKVCCCRRVSVWLCVVF